MAKPIFDSVHLNIDGPDGNALVIIGVVINCLQQAGWHPKEWQEIRSDMLSSDYKHLCEVASKYIHLDNYIS